MSYLVLARKWRPQTFADVVGQEPVVRTLQNAITRERIPHAMIFSGVRGVGKTTLARLMAKALNCQQGPTPTPCNACDSCNEIVAGSAIDLHEIDGASNRGIQEIRELKENIRFFPTKGRYKIIIIDEVHMLTTEAFNALLKTLEEPPAHVIFIFATTELHKIPITILSRCQRYELKRVPFALLASFFTRIAQEEGVAVNDRALALIVREAGGSVRDGLSLLDQVFSFGGDRISEDDVSLVLGLVDNGVIGSIVRALLAGDIGLGLELLDRVYSLGIDLKRFTADLLAYYRALLVCRTTSQPHQLLDLADNELESVIETANAHSWETLHQGFQFLLKGVDEMQYSSQPRLVLETTFMKMVQAGTVVPVTTILERLDGLLKGIEPGVLQEGASAAGSSRPVKPRAAAPPADREKGAGKRSSTGPADTTVSPADVATGKDNDAPLGGPVGQRLAPGRAEKRSDASPSVLKKSEPQGAAAGKLEGEADVSATASPPAPLKAGDISLQKEVRKHWGEFIDYVQDRKKWMGLILRLSSGVVEQEGELIIRFDDSNDCKRLQDAENKKVFTEFFLDFFQKEPQRLTFQVKGQSGSSEDGHEAKSPQLERRALANDALVEMATEIFGGQVANIRTGPRSR